MTNDACPELIRLLRLQRHDFINHLQVVHALLQMGRVDRAVEYIEDLANSTVLLDETLHQHQQRNECHQKITGAPT